MERLQRRRLRPQPRLGRGRLATTLRLGLGLAALVAGTASALIGRRPAPSPMGGAAGPHPLLARAWQQAGRQHLPVAASSSAVAGAGGGSGGRCAMWMTALGPERPKGQVRKEEPEPQAAGSAWYQPRLLVEAAQQPPRTTLQRPAASQPPIDLQDPNVEVTIRPAIADEIPMVVDLRHDVFSAACALEKEEDAAAVAEWKARSLANLRARRAKGAVLLVATARDRRWGAGAAPLLVGSLEYSHHEFRETGFSPILAGDLYCEEYGEDEEHCYLFDYDDEGNVIDEEEREWSCWGDTSTTLHRRASASFRRPASRSPSASDSSSGGSTCSTTNGGSLGDKLYVTGVMVAACCRRQGLGASLLQAVEEHAQELRTPYICMFVEPSNAAALALYTRRAGFHFVPYSPTAEAFAAAIGLYKGPYAARQYAFVYKRLELPPAPATPQGADGGGGGGGGGGGAESSRRLVLDDAPAAALPFPARRVMLGSSFFS